MSAGGWSHGPVLIAGSSRARRTGLCPLALGWGLLVAGRSVHGRGMAEPLTVVGIDAAGAVMATTRLHPGELVIVSGAAALLELPGDVAGPLVGTVLVWAPVRR